MILFYLALWSTSNNPAKRFAAGQVAYVDRSSSVGTTVDEALDACAGWPVHVYEAEAAPEDDAAKEDEPAPRRGVTRVMITRVLSQEEVFGPRAAELEFFLSELPNYPWLAPVGAPDMARLAGLVKAHYWALAKVSPVECTALCLVHDWKRAPWQQVEALRPSASGYPAALHQFMDEQECRSRVVVRHVAEMAAYHMAYLPAWEAAWRIATADCVELKMGRDEESECARSELQQIRIEFLEAIRRRGRGAWETAEWLDGVIAPMGSLAGVPDDGLLPNGALRRLLTTSSSEELQTLWNEVSGAVRAVLNRSAEVAADFVTPSDKPNPSAPLFEIVRLGYWPLGEVAGKFLVFAPPSAAP
jgi:hypothetical protein